MKKSTKQKKKVNRKRLPRTISPDPTIWAAAVARATQEDRKVTQIIEYALRAYLQLPEKGPV